MNAITAITSNGLSNNGDLFFVASFVILTLIACLAYSVGYRDGRRDTLRELDDAIDRRAEWQEQPQLYAVRARWQPYADRAQGRTVRLVHRSRRPYDWEKERAL